MTHPARKKQLRQCGISTSFVSDIHQQPGNDGPANDDCDDNFQRKTQLFEK
jgi:hypothetical protein